jgi:Zn-dependent peptidase ImmA (M78 family)/transcriptional regulator with XRE-family HTH domain
MIYRTAAAAKRVALEAMINRDRISQVREAKRWTQADLAKKVGRSQSAIAQLENGLIDGSDGLIRKIASETGFPTEFFERENGPAFPFGSLLFRAHASMSSKDRLEAHGQAHFVFQLMTTLLKQVHPIPINLPRPVDTPEVGARVARRFFHLSPAEPVGNLLSLLEQNGVLVLAILDLKGRDAFSLWAGSDRTIPTIAIAGGRPGDRLRLTVAHELGHLIMHAQKEVVSPLVEDEANKFAAEFLMPEQAIRKDLATPLTLTRLASLKPKWKVSIQALIVRAKNLEIISERQYRYLYEQLAIQGWKINEPENLAVEPEKPRSLRQLAEMSYGHPIDFKAFAKDAALPESLVRQIISQYRDKRSVEPDDAKISKKVVQMRRKA